MGAPRGLTHAALPWKKPARGGDAPMRVLATAGAILPMLSARSR